MSNASGQVIQVDLAEQLALLESLPVELRQLVQQAPVQVDLRVIWAFWCRFGTYAQQLIEAEFDKEFPKWKITPASRSRKLRNTPTRNGKRCVRQLSRACEA